MEMHTYFIQLRVKMGDENEMNLCSYAMEFEAGHWFCSESLI